MKATLRIEPFLFTLEYEVVMEGVIRILNYSVDRSSYDLETKLPQFNLKQTDNQFVTHVFLRAYQEEWLWLTAENAEEVYEVVNPRHLKSYSQKETSVLSWRL